MIATIERGSYASVAKSLYMTPQAVSKGISDLEKELEIKLFVKSGRGIEATSNGVLLATKATEIIQSCEDLKRYAGLLNCDNEMGAFGSLVIALASSPYEGGIISRTVIDQVIKQYSGIKVELIYSPSGAGLSALYKDVADASIILGRVKMEQFICTKLFESELRIAVSRLHPLGKQHYVSLDDLINYPLAKPYDLRCCYQEIVTRFGRINFSPRFVDLPSSVESYDRFLQEDSGVIFVSYNPSLDSLHADVNFISLDKDDRITIPVCIAWRQGNKEKLLSLIQKSLIQSLRDEKRMPHKDKRG